MYRVKSALCLSITLCAGAAGAVTEGASRQPGGPAPTGCSVIYESFNELFPPSQVEPFHPVNIWFDGEHTGTIQFIPERDFRLCEIHVTAAHTGGPNGFRIALYNDENGLPANEFLATWPIEFPPARGEVEPTVLDVSGDAIDLEAGRAYWIGTRVWEFPATGHIHHSTIPGLEGQRAEIIASMGGWVNVNKLGWNPNPGAWRLLGEAQGGVECTGGEAIKKARCKDKGGSNELTVKLIRGTPGDTFTVTLGDGREESGGINGKGKGKIRLSGVDSGPGKALVRWDCGARAVREYRCP